ncbi:hypothetical protein TWF225_000710 [Orbilia oligospora]|nr:hypothetical protein TWF225_000710 [Orbilia oligospora]KAF3237196.1 hypothetical protein TWF128_000964 [Orbilia oligospora]KAF3242334.1 hypothetical protein TWF217_011761 [Orbilia oligospora]
MRYVYAPLMIMLFLPPSAMVHAGKAQQTEPIEEISREGFDSRKYSNDLSETFVSKLPTVQLSNAPLTNYIPVIILVYLSIQSILFHPDRKCGSARGIPDRKDGIVSRLPKASETLKYGSPGPPSATEAKKRRVDCADGKNQRPHCDCLPAHALMT